MLQRWFGVAVAVAGFVCVAPGAARAGGYLGVDLDTGIAIGDNMPAPELRLDSQYGVRGRFGFEVGDELRLAFEGGGGYTALPPASIGRAFVGARLAFGTFIAPVVYGHIGYAQTSFSTSPAEMMRPVERTPMYDVGAALDFVGMKVLRLGLHADYNVMMAQHGGRDLRFVAVGLHGTLGN